jgi:hypothetical protein
MSRANGISWIYPDEENHLLVGNLVEKYEWIFLNHLFI